MKSGRAFATLFERRETALAVRRVDVEDDDPAIAPGGHAQIGVGPAVKPAVDHGVVGGRLALPFLDSRQLFPRP
jgi:hypothetical protein